MEQRICTRCLLRDMIGADAAIETEMQMIDRYRDAIKLADRVAEQEYEKRLNFCRDCEKLISGTCLACGCYVELRAIAKSARCPHKKW